MSSGFMTIVREKSVSPIETIERKHKTKASEKEDGDQKQWAKIAAKVAVAEPHKSESVSFVFAVVIVA